ncbi:MAG: hypothetical protein KDD53_03000, partial [Bdellovibrionales bacterium]|nr:hypothetical protein [Bdellovibrionales bacterium]
GWLSLGATTLGDQLAAEIAPVQESLKSFKKGVFSLVLAKLQTEMIQYFLDEMHLFDEETRGYSTEEARHLIELLSKKGEETFLYSMGQLHNLASSTGQLRAALGSLERQVSGLSLAHVNGRVECSRLPEATSLEVILSEVIDHINSTTGILDKFGKTCLEIESTMSSICNKGKDLSKLYAQVSACLS